MTDQVILSVTNLKHDVARRFVGGSVTLDFHNEFADILGDEIIKYLAAGYASWHVANIAYEVVRDFTKLDTCRKIYLQVFGLNRSDINNVGWTDGEIMARFVTLLILDKAKQVHRENWLINYQMFAV